ncbi:unnamed protein product, partial [Didymodactylos carnosus]
MRQNISERQSNMKLRKECYHRPD